jgi:LAO/AO transport system kinase
VTGTLAAGVLSGDRRALAKAITLIESRRRDPRETANALLEAILPSTGGSIRVGVSGSPGAGKSSVIEALGMHALGEGHRVAVLAVDPSSKRSGGSILGDKTRMAELARQPGAYIRPSPSGGTLGGVARQTRDTLLLCEAAGFDLVLVETVGVGQSEVAVADLVDLFLLIASPTGGDELQGIKRGIMELADVIVVNKADGALRNAADRAVADLRNAVHLLRPKRPGWEVEVLICSALEGRGIAELWEALSAAHQRLAASGELHELRSHQATSEMWGEISEALLDRLRADPQVQERLPGLQADVAAGRLSARAAADALLQVLARLPRSD